MTHPPRLLWFPFASLLCAALAACWWANPALAEKADRLKPMNIEADALRHDDLKQTSVFTGNVVLTKGSMVMRGARIEVRQDPEGYQYATVQSAAPKQAYFKQKRDGADESIEAESDTVYYNGKADVMTFTKQAVLRRYKGALLNDETQGSLITYNNATDIFTVESRVGAAAPNASAATSSNPGGRIRAMLTPRAALEVAVPGAPSAAPAPAAANLRKSPQLGDGKPAAEGKQ